MKTRNSERMRRMVSTRKRAAVFSAVCVILLVILFAVIVKIATGQKGTGELPAEHTDTAEETGAVIQQLTYFEDSGYPAQFRMEGSSIRAELDGSITPELKWDILCVPEDTVSIELSGEEQDGRLSFLISPLMTGYADLTCVRNMTVGEQEYAVAALRIGAVVSENPYGSLELSLTDVQQTLMELGAENTAYPYLLNGDSILFPNGGDWIVEPEESAGGYYILYEPGGSGNTRVVRLLTQPTVLEGMDDAALEQVLNAGIVMESKELGIRQTLRVTFEEDGQMKLTAAEGT